LAALRVVPEVRLSKHPQQIVALRTQRWRRMNFSDTLHAAAQRRQLGPDLRQRSAFAPGRKLDRRALNHCIRLRRQQYGADLATGAALNVHT
jgi:hypothetical protein